MEIEQKLERIAKMLEKLKEGWVLVEGIKDRKALAELGIMNVLTASGNLRQSVQLLAENNVKMAYVLTDLDRRGNQLARIARDELESNSIRADLEMRGELAYLLGIRNFEDAKRAYDKLKGD